MLMRPTDESKYRGSALDYFDMGCEYHDPWDEWFDTATNPPSSYGPTYV